MKQKTQNEYISLAEHFYRTRLSGKALDVDNIWAALLQSAPDYKPAYFQRLKAAIAYHQNCIGNGWTAKVVRATQNPLKVFPAAFPDIVCDRAHSISMEKFTSLISYLKNKGLREECAALLLIFKTGARPCELFGMRVQGDRVHIEGAKKTDRGNRGADRWLVGFAEDFTNDVDQLLTVLTASSKTMDSMRISIYQAVKELFPRDKKTISMYTIRHQFGSNLKASSLSRVEMAYIMGHQSTESISRYGDKRLGLADWVVVKPAPDSDLSHVRDKTSTKIWSQLQSNADADPMPKKVME